MSRTEYTVVGEKPESIWHGLKELWDYRPLIREMVRRELNIRYKNRVGGILWSLFPPLMQVLTLTIMVKLFLAPVNNYSAYLMAVLFLWQFFMNTILDSGNSLLGNVALVKKIYFPRAILPLVALITNGIHFCIALCLTLLYFFLIPFGSPIYPQNIRWEILLVFPTILGVGMLAMGLGFFLARLSTLYEDMRFLSTNFFTLFFYVVPILYPVERVAARQDIYPYYMLNPVASFLVTFQRALLPPLVLDEPNKLAHPVGIPWPFLGIAFVSSAFILLLGFYVFERSKAILIERI